MNHQQAATFQVPPGVRQVEGEIKLPIGAFFAVAFRSLESTSTYTPIHMQLVGVKHSYLQGMNPYRKKVGKTEANSPDLGDKRISVHNFSKDMQRPDTLR